MSMGISDYRTYHNSKKKRKEVSLLPHSTMTRATSQQTRLKDRVCSCCLREPQRCSPPEVFYEQCNQLRMMANDTADSVIFFDGINNNRNSKNCTHSCTNSTTSEMCSSPKNDMSSNRPSRSQHYQHQHDHHQVSSAKYHSETASERWWWRNRLCRRDVTREPIAESELLYSSRRRKRTESASPKMASCWLTASFSLLSVMMLLLAVTLPSPALARHYIAPGPCTWTHVSPPSFASSRDMRLKSALNSASSSSSLHHHHPHLHHLLPHHPSFSSGGGHHLESQSSLSGGVSDFDVSLRCSVSSLTPYTLNLSMIEPEHTVKLAIGCFGGSSDDLNSGNGDRSTLRQDGGGNTGGMRSSLPPPGPFEHLRFLNTLSIDGCKLDSLPSDSFRGLPSLRNLTIRNAVFPQSSTSETTAPSFTVESTSFRPVEAHLEYLDLGMNQLDRLPADLFCPFVNLRTLNLTGNRLPDLSSFGLIDPATGRLCLQELLDLDLSHNKLELVPENSGVATLRNLKYLNLSSNHISEIAELAFSALKNLNMLDLSGNQLRSLPGRLFRDSEMTVLRLANNGLMELPVGLFKMLAKLLVLDVSGNQITSETFNKETFADLIRLVVLDLSRNRLRHISAFTFQNQYSLQVLSLEGNVLETVDDGAFVTLYNLHTLKLAGNRFRHLSDAAMTGLFMLNTLSLAGNQLEHLHEEAFRNCTNLQKLDINDNRLTTLPTAIRALRTLTTLNFSGNKLVTLTEPGPLSHTSQLARLDLSKNYLVNVTRNAFRPLGGTLLELRLDGNRLRSLEKNTLEDLKGSLAVLRLDRNEFADISSALAHVKQLERLESLNVSHNAITWFDYSVVPASLRSLDLSHNRIEQLRNYYELEAKLRLENLDVSYNLIKEIAATSVPHSIRTLNLFSNRIEKVDAGAFVAKHNVTYVDMRNNSLRRIDNTAFKLGVQRPTSSYFLNRPVGGAGGGGGAGGDHYYLNGGGSDATFDAKYLPPPIFLISGNPYYCDCTMEWLQRVNQLVGGVTGSGAISTYPRIGDLEEVNCELPFTRQAVAATSAAAAAAASSAVVDQAGKGSGSEVAPLKAAVVQVPLLQANSSNFLCRYRTHCFTVCHCCDFDACDCEMMCPENCTCYYDQTWNTNIVDCSAANYRNVPPRIPMDVTSLYLDGNQLFALNAHTFIGRKNLRVLHLNHSSVESIANRSFNGLVYLEELHLEHNQLTTLNGFEFEGLLYLTTLHLEYNQIAFVHEKTFATLRSLQLLRLDHNRLTTFGHWFSPSGLFGSLDFASNSAYHSRYLSVSLSSNPWACDSCGSMAMLYDTLPVVSLQLHITDAYEVRCLQQPAKENQSATVHLLRHLKDIEQAILGRCNLSAHMLPTFSPNSAEAVRPAGVPSYNSNGNGNGNNNSPTDHHQQQQLPNYSKGVYAPPKPSGPNYGQSEDGDSEDGTPIQYRPIDTVTKHGAGIPGLSELPDLTSDTSESRNVHQSQQPSSSSAAEQNSFFNWISANIVFSLVLLCSVVVLSGLAAVGIRRKKDIQLWFFWRYGIRLFDSGFCGFCRGGGEGGGGSRRGHGFSHGNHCVPHSEKLYDAFVIYARADEQFVTQHLASELECGYPPYNLCLRYRDLPVPTTSSSSDGNNSSSATNTASKDNGHAFEAVTRVIEYSRRTLVVISEAFLQSDWCKFELKAAHQETLSSRKAHRLIAVVVPSPGGGHMHSQTPTAYHHPLHPQQLQQQQTPVNKLAEMLLSRLDNESKACIRGVTVLSWGERRFWEKLRFLMPPSSAAPVCSGEGVKGRSSTVVVATNNIGGAGGYPTLAGASSLSSSSSLARSSVLYDTSQPIYYPNHHYHYAQLPPPGGAGGGSRFASTGASSLHKSSSLSIFGKQAGHHQSTTLVPPTSTHQPMLSGFRNPFNSKPLPPPPNQPLPPLPLVNSQHYLPQQILPIIPGGGHHHHQDANATTYATCSEYGGGGGEYETTGESIASALNHHHQQQQYQQQQQQHQQMSGNNNNNNNNNNGGGGHLNMAMASHTLHGQRARAGLAHQPQFYHSSRRAPL